MNTLLPLLALAAAQPDWDDRPRPHFLRASDPAAWAALPQKTPLPPWATVLVGTLPKTTAAMLEQDYVHRAENPLGPALAAELRLAAADAVGCEYARATANADRWRAPDRPGDPADVAAAVAFARKLTLAGHTVTDAEVADLQRRYGPAKTVAIVHTVAYANFQNRIVLALGIPDDPGGPPLPFRYDPDGTTNTPPRPDWKEVVAAKVPPGAAPDWSDLSPAAALRERLAAQQRRTARIAPPGKEAFAGLPPDVKAQSEKIVWMAVSAGYQPQLTAVWFAGLRAFQQEARSDRVFSSSLFWVVTRANDCFY